MADPGLGGKWLPLDPDAEIQVDAVGGKAVLEILCKARVGGGMRALGDGAPELGVGVRRLHHVEGRPPEVSVGQPLDVSTEGAAVVVTDGGAHSEGNKSYRQEGPFE